MNMKRNCRTRVAGWKLCFEKTDQSYRSISTCDEPLFPIRAVGKVFGMSRFSWKVRVDTVEAIRKAVLLRNNIVERNRKTTLHLLWDIEVEQTIRQELKE